MIDLNGISRPTLLLSEEICRRNISIMAEKARRSDVNFRPHFKTHQSLTIGNWFRDEAVKSITVSSVTMARHFASDGWKDITIAFPSNTREAESMKEISAFARLNILVAGTEHLSQVLDRIRFEAGCFLKINTGLNRSGTDWNDREQIMDMFMKIRESDKLRFMGFLTHAGHTYNAKSVTEIAGIYKDSIEKMTSVKSFIDAEGIIISVGDTPSCSTVDKFSGADEIRPGNFVFYDLTQNKLGSCQKDQIAVAVACPVVDKNRRTGEIIIYGGGVHLSKDRLQLDNGKTVFGLAVLLDDTGWHFPAEDSYLRSISQEHGIISASDELFKSVRTGDLIGIIPVHSCMTADLLREYHTTDGRIISDFSPK